MVTYEQSGQPARGERTALPSDIGHDLRSPLAVIRMQAQMLMRLVKRGPTAADAFERERLMVGLQRIDEAVSTLNRAIERATDEQPSRPSRRDGVPDVH